MINYNNIVNKNNLKVNKVTIKNNVTIIATPLGKFVLKKNKGIKIYNYLLSRGFNNIPKIIDYDNEVILFEYLDNINYEYNERANDYIKLLSVMHIKTTYFINISNEVNINIYESINERLEYLNNYYNNVTNIIETKEYMSPKEYYLIRNSSIIFSAINYTKYELEDWYKTYKNEHKKRVVTLLNDIDINNMIKTTNNEYFTSLDNTIIDSPIYDLISFYNKYSNVIDFSSLLKIYENKFPLLKEEKQLFFILISVPEEINLNSSFKDIKDKINKVYNTLYLLNSEKEEKGSAHKNKDNK